MESKELIVGATNARPMHSLPNFVEDELRNNTGGFGGTGSAFSVTAPSAVTSNQLCCLIDENVRCSRVAGNASYSKRIQKTVQQKKLRLTIDNNARHHYICDYHKSIIQSVRMVGKRKRKDSCDEDNGANSNDGYSVYDYSPDLPQVDLSALQVNTLRRYKRHFRIQTRPGMNKSQLSETLMKHFRTQPVIEKEAITYFIYMVKCNRNKLDQMKGLGNNSSYISGSSCGLQSGSGSEQINN
ncbi:histone deacetylase complex subunit SAP30L-like protein [Dinothrombium tinctorium]|uniref:Histone deacetylase complex subunit SAP30L-like protein n=1 Tax=Dinothrombium tinctorium TaxID=1965070 RepID=A0A3S3P4W9_9ACAR|nr:histone deacetylase complex subunit SAP30L-like protein [Dinothrombium tinctorium]RWS05213.1 histone deacetylase complex subunit SAP30L-like protein [Dinothrombium tinctorium]